MNAKVVLITGALTRIGRAAALAFAKEGAHLIEAASAGVPLKRMGRPEEVAQTILFLALDNAPFITGQIVGIDCGKMA